MRCHCGATMFATYPDDVYGKVCRACFVPVITYVPPVPVDGWKLEKRMKVRKTKKARGKCA